MNASIHIRHVLITLLLGLAFACVSEAHPPVHHAQGVRMNLDGGVLSLRLIRDNVLRVHFMPHGKRAPHTLVIAPDAPKAADHAHIQRHATRRVLQSPSMRVDFNTRTGELKVFGADPYHALLQQTDMENLARGQFTLNVDPDAPLYGVHGFNATEAATSGLLRRGRQIARAGKQGNAGAPLVWSTAGFAVLVDSKGASFDLADGRIGVGKLSRSPDYNLIVGNPGAIFAAVADLSGHPPLFPKWAMGFTNSQWGIDEQQLLDIVHTYRDKHIPLDNFTLDFDWKAWGKDHYGEFRWNPVKFPHGPSGKLAHMLATEGVHLTGIMKPRIHVNTVEGRYATEHHLWIPGEKASDDYFSHKPVRDIDFDMPLSRRWFGKLAMKYAFDKGILGWWNDEADETDDDTQFLNMQRALYTAQRAQTNVRVWSINRNFWLGAQRYAYGLWSGDIPSGFASMAAQRQRMLSAIGVGEMQWGMDIGGYKSRPSDQNYARWMEFGAFVPIFRVHGTFDQKRQPWRYGPVAEKAAAHAIRLRYRLIPYIYAYAWHDHVAGVGLVRPLSFVWPHDPKLRNDVDAWMFGQWLLVSPVVKKNQTEKHLYLPAGVWTEWSSGKTLRGGQTVSVPVDSQHWSDIPLFIRQGAIIPTQPVMNYVGQHPVATITVDVFASGKRTHFDYYDDDGETYAYERGKYYLQRLSTWRDAHGTRFRIDAPKGSYKPALRHYLVKMHGAAASSVQRNGQTLKKAASLKALCARDAPGWLDTHDRYGAVTVIKLPAGESSRVHLKTPPHRMTRS